MTFALFVYLAGIVGALKFTLLLISVFIVVPAPIFFLIGYAEDDTKTARWSARLFKWAVGLVLLSAIIPSERTMYFMAGAYAGQQVIESQTAQHVIEIVNNKLEAYARELKTK